MQCSSVQYSITVVQHPHLLRFGRLIAVTLIIDPIPSAILVILWIATKAKLEIIPNDSRVEPGIVVHVVQHKGLHEGLPDFQEELHCQPFSNSLRRFKRKMVSVMLHMERFSARVGHVGSTSLFTLAYGSPPPPPSVPADYGRYFTRFIKNRQD